MADPVHIAAIDAGSNAVRLLVVRAYSALDIEPLLNERYPLRLGEGVFVRSAKKFSKRRSRRSGTSGKRWTNLR
jgi:exopolyphosphatase/pppGpp-phosphohydrolase